MRTGLDSGIFRGVSPAAGIVVRPPAAWLVHAILAWAGVVLAVYFRHAWALVSGAEGAWAWPEIGQTLRYTGLPHAHEALLRAGWAVGGAVASALAVLGLGVLVARVFALKPASFAEWLILRGAFGAGALGCALYFLAGIGVYTPHVVRPLVLVLAVTGCVLASAEARDARS